MKAVILAGGSGTRLWPLSRKKYPKQFLKLNGDESLLKQTVDRLLGKISSKDIIVVTNKDHKFHTEAELPNVKDIILEPVAKNTAPAIALALIYCLEKLGCKEDEVIFVGSSDHAIKPQEKFIKYLKMAERQAKKGYIVTFGIKPDRPETGYGYILTEKCLDKKDKAFKVKKFVEKPSSETAKRYLKSGKYFWNSGMFAFTIKTLLSEFKSCAPEIYKVMSLGYTKMLKNFKKLPEISIDYAICEKSNKVVNLPLDIYWNDIGSWDALYDVLEKDKNKNVRQGDVMAIDTQNTLVIGNKRCITTIGMKDCLVIETDDAILVAKRGEAQKVKDIVSLLKSQKRKEADEHLTLYREWGNYTILEEGPRYKIKKVILNPSKEIGLQVHRYRTEHWVVLKGKAKAQIGKKKGCRPKQVSF